MRLSSGRPEALSAFVPVGLGSAFGPVLRYVFQCFFKSCELLQNVWFLLNLAVVHFFYPHQLLHFPTFSTIIGCKDSYIAVLLKTREQSYKFQRCH